MSIFQIKEWWAASVGNSEEFDSKSITFGNIDCASPPVNKIIVGKSSL